MRNRPLAGFSFACLIVALSIGRGDTARAQQLFVPALGTLPASAAEVPNEFLLRAPADRVGAIAARHGLRIIRALDGHDVYLVSGSDSTYAAVQFGGGPLQVFLSKVQADPEVTDFELNAVAIAPEVPSGITLNQSPVEILDSLGDLSRVDYFGDQAWVGYVSQRAATAIRVSESHQVSGTGAGIVAIIDTGIDPNHPILAGSLVPGYDFVRDVEGAASEWADLDPGTAAILDQSPVEILDSAVPLNQSTVGIMNQATASSLNASQLPPAFGHGTMVAGVVHLVAPTARIMPLKAFHADGTSRVFDIVRAIYYAVEHGADVINMSFSTTTWSREITHAINFATSHGVVCVSSAGNLGQETVAYPAGLRNVLGVGSTSSANPPTRSSFTNYGDALVSLGAPGEAIITTYPGGGYAGAWGTSFSTPMVAGAAALLLQVDSALDQIKADSLFEKADRMASAGMGKGRLNLLEVVRSLPDATPPTVAMVTPAGGGTLFDSIFVSATASDNVGLAGVRFLLDDNALAEDTTAPYELTWNTATVANGSHVLTAVARDAAGNATAASIGVTVSNDTTPPVVTVPANLTLTATSAAGAVATFSASALDAIDGALAATCTPLSGSTFSIGTTPVTCSATDARGTTGTASFTVTVSNDTTAPVVTVPANLTVAATSAAGAVASFSASALDAIDGALAATCAPLSGSTFAIGMTPVTCSATDASGTTGTAGFTVTVSDTTAPVVTAPANLTVAATSAAGAVATFSASALDAIDGALAATCTPLSGSTFAIGTTPVTCSATDASGTTGTAGFTVTVSDTTAPVVTAPANLTVAATSAAGAVASFSASALDAIDGALAATCTPLSGSTFAIGTTPVTCSATDASGTTGTAGFTVTVSDTTAPEVTVPAALTLAATSAAGAVASFNASALDAIDGALAATCTPLSGSTFAIGTTPVTCSATDASGITGTAGFTVTVSDTTAPVVTVPAALTLAATSAAGAVASFNASALDAIDGALAATCTPLSGSTFAIGTTPVTCSATDASGTTGTAGFTVTVSDTTAPVVTVPAALTLAATSAAGAVGSFSASALDAIDGALAATCTPLSGSTFAIGTTPVTCSATDASGTTGTAGFTVTVSDTTAPTVAVTSPAAAGSVTGMVTVEATASDDVGIVSVEFLLDGMPLGAADLAAPYEFLWPTATAANGVHTVTAVARDAAGHQTTASAEVTVTN